ncbi:hypothetical protein NUW58_g931 [Xylaria curta]|uniref:Uncharacterized protein n=1 Tax=Xylaria curta TaxID=42375 RepID=A0ACC1PQ40_9PEZI|nr:hypothetical protein NUW58_g931 [Xylaria curta]
MESNTDDLSGTLYRTVPADGPDSIRLIHLLPGAFTDELRCTLTGADLSTNPHYEALSYVWGKPVFDATIVCNEDIPFKITSSLHRALVRLRAVNEDVWSPSLDVDWRGGGEQAADDGWAGGWEY